MNLSDQIGQFFEANVTEISISKPPQLEGRFLVQVSQPIATSADGGRMNVMHQETALSVVNALEAIRKRVNFCQEQAAKIDLA